MSRSDVSAYRPGRFVLDKYELVEPVAEGTMGVVWLARHSTLDIDVAVKLPSSAESGAGSQLRAFTEARMAAQLLHPAVCRVLDFGLTAEGDPCVVTEWLEGETLASTLAREGKLPATEAVQLLLPVLEALSMAHAHGIVHQDVKPENLFLARDEQQRLLPKVLDFGIARERHRRASWLRAGLISGTPYYMSPEQASGREDIDHRADIWSACATLYEVIAGRPPFDGETCEVVLAQVVGDAPKPLFEHGGGDSWLSALVDRGLEKDRDRRYASIGELATALASWLIDQGVETDATGQSLRVRFGVNTTPEQSRVSWTRPLQTTEVAIDWR
ncbi:MAG: serine/threonine protein kinase [Myxococcota bacterium]|jgi:eukaryotic-like serine/threonine-protein kinase|nr:serine/threonine protein kinase [Myxococcota bacterium]